MWEILAVLLLIALMIRPHRWQGWWDKLKHKWDHRGDWCDDSYEDKDVKPGHARKMYPRKGTMGNPVPPPAQGPVQEGGRDGKKD